MELLPFLCCSTSINFHHLIVNATASATNNIGTFQNEIFKMSTSQNQAITNLIIQGIVIGFENTGGRMQSGVVETGNIIIEME